MGSTWNPFMISGNGGAEDDVRCRFGGRGFVIVGEMAPGQVGNWRESKIDSRDFSSEITNFYNLVSKFAYLPK
jgi:hypothetical protein